jgi:small conductance mechanosensitive channel
MADLLALLKSWGPLAEATAKALVVLILGWLVAGTVSRLIRRRVLASEELDDTIGTFLATVAWWAIMLGVVAAVLGIFGIDATTLAASMGAATLAVGLALQGAMGDAAAGFLIIFFRPYRLGEYVDIGGTAGTVKDITLFTTELSTPDNVKIIMPNGKAWGTVIINYSANDTRRLDLTFGIGYDDDAEKAMALILETAKEDGRIHADPEPWVRVTALNTSSVDVTARLWCATADYWDLKFTLTKAVKDAFDKNGITIPYPHVVQIRTEG